MLTKEQKQLLEETNLPLYLLLEAEEVNSDDAPDQSKSSDEQDSQHDDANLEQQADDASDTSDAPSEQEIFQAEMEGSEDKFIQFVLYDKLTDLSSKIDILLDNIKNDTLTDNLEIVSKLEHYKQYLSVLNELIFTVSTVVVYRILGQIELEIIDLLEVYNAKLEESKMQKEAKEAGESK